MIALWRGAERTRRLPKQAELKASVISGEDGVHSAHTGCRGAVDRCLVAVVARVLREANSRVHCACVSTGVILSSKESVNNTVYKNYKKGNQTVLSYYTFILNIITICLQKTKICIHQKR